MSMRRPAAGRQVSTGVLRVDAARAIAKLRDFQLANPSAWILEAIRAAVASGATSISLDGDADDIWLSWTGNVWPVESLPELLSELVSPGGGKGREFRLLATAVNSALGADTAYVDVYGFDEGSCQKLRFAPSLLEAGEEMGNASPLDALTLVQAKVPSRAPQGCALFVHMHRKLGFKVLRNFLRGEPPEFELVRKSCLQLPIPLEISGERLRLEQEEVLAVDFGRDLQGGLALLPPAEESAGKGAMMEIAEFGVRITSYPVAISNLAPLRAVPIRITLNSERMPTNASRSDVRREDYPLQEAESLLQERFAELCQLTAEQFLSSEEQAMRLRPSIVDLLAGVVSGPKWDWHASTLKSPYRELAKLPLLQNAIGDWKQASAGWESGIVYRGKKPLPAEYEPWVRGILWAMPGSIVERLLGPNSDTVGISHRLRRAKSQLKSRLRFMAKAQRPAILGKLPKHWIRCGITAASPNTCAPALQSVSEGELCLTQSGEGGTLTILLDGREIEELVVPSPLPFRAIVSTTTLSTLPDYEGVRRNRSFEKVIEAVLRCAVRAVESMCVLGVEGYQYAETASPGELRALAINAMQFSAELDLAIGSESPMAQAKLWALKAEGGLTCLSELRTQQIVGVANSEQHEAELRGRMVVVSENPRERDFLVKILGSRLGGPDIIRYGFRDQFFSPVKSATLMAQLEGCVCLLIDTEEMSGIIAWGALKAESQVHYFHCGKRIEAVQSKALPRHALIMVDSSRFVPSSNWDKLKRGHLSDEEVGIFEKDLILASARALAGEDNSSFISTKAFSLQSSAGRTFVQAIGRYELGPSFFGESLWQRLADAPLFMRLDGSEASANQLSSDFDGVIDSLQAVPKALLAQSILGLESGWNPLIGAPWVIWLVNQLSGARCHRAVERARKEAVAIERREKVARHMRKELAISPHRATKMQMAKGVLDFEFEAGKGLVGIAKKVLQLHYFVEGRFFKRYSEEGPLPLVALLLVSETAADEEFEEIPAEARARLIEKLSALAPQVLVKAIAEEPSCLQSATSVRVFCMRWLRSLEDSETRSPKDLSVMKAIFASASFVDQRGVKRTLEEFVKGGVLRVSAAPGDSWVDTVAGQEAHFLDEPLLSLSMEEGEGTMDFLRFLYSEGVVVDYSEKTKLLQVERRLALGLLRLPTLQIDSRYKRRLSDLDSSEKLGEIGFHKGELSEVRLFRDGDSISRREVKSLPSILLAIEDPTVTLFDHSNRLSPGLLERIATMSQALALSVVESGETGILPAWLCDSLAKALACGHIKPLSALAEACVFATTVGDYISWNALKEQEERFGGVWYTEREDTRTPIADGQVALALGLSEQDVCTSLLFWQADEDLRLDELTRKNRSRAKVTSLELSEKEAAAVVAVLPLSGLEGLEGVIAPLKPDAASMREVRAHRRMRPIGSAEDPCSWPTLCILEYPELLPDRTWSAPQENKAWEKLSSHLRCASDDAITTLFPVPAEAITSYWVGAYVESKLSEVLGSGACVRGRLWITESALPGSIAMHSRFGRSEHCAHADISSAIELPIHGQLWLYHQSLIDPEEVVQEVVSVLYGRMLTKVAKHASLNADQRLAHLALGVLAEAVNDSLSNDLIFDCFRPPLDSHGLLTMAKSERPLEVVRQPQGEPMSDAYALVPSASALFNALSVALSQRMKESVVTPSIHELDVLPTPVLAPPPVRAALPKRPDHVLNPLADALWKKLRTLGPQVSAFLLPFVIAPDRIDPMVAFEGGRIVLAGECLLLLQLMASHPAGQKLSESLVSVLCSHCIEVASETLSGNPRGTLLSALSNS